MNEDVMCLCELATKIPYCIVAHTIIIVTLIVCGTIGWISRLKIKMQVQQHDIALKEAEKIKEKCCKRYKLKCCEKTDIENTEGEENKNE